MQASNVTKARKLLQFTEVFTSLEDDNELRELLGNVPSLVYKKFQVVDGIQQKAPWASAYDTITRISYPVNPQLKDVDIFLMIEKIAFKLSKFFKSSDFKIRRQSDGFSVNYKSIIKQLRDRSSLLNASVYIHDKTYVVQVVVCPDDFKTYIQRYNSTVQLDLFRTYTEKLSHACDILVRGLRLLDVDSLS